MRIKKITLTIVVIIGLGFLFGGHFYNKWYHKNVKSHPTRYCYEYFRGTEESVSVLIIQNLNLKEPYLEYYRELESGKEPYLHNDIPLKGLPQSYPVYVVGYTKDSLLAEVVSYYDYGARMGGSFTKGWVYAKCLHKEPPQKEEIKE
ncbi:MAG: hypothetical protein WCY89_02870 [Flavobacteriaceae bacterium]